MQYILEITILLLAVCCIFIHLYSWMRLPVRNRHLSCITKKLLHCVLYRDNVDELDDSDGENNEDRDPKSKHCKVCF